MKRREFLNIGLLTLGGVLVGRNFAFADALSETKEIFQKSDDRPYDVIINGAGLYGFFLALAAVQKGLKVLIIDKRTSPGFDIAAKRRLWLNERGVEQWNKELLDLFFPVGEREEISNDTLEAPRRSKAGEEMLLFAGSLKKGMLRSLLVNQVDVFLMADVCGMLTNRENTLAGVVVATKHGLFSIPCHNFIDATDHNLFTRELFKQNYSIRDAGFVLEFDSVLKNQIKELELQGLDLLDNIVRVHAGKKDKDQYFLEYRFTVKGNGLSPIEQRARLLAAEVSRKVRTVNPAFAKARMRYTALECSLNVEGKLDTQKIDIGNYFYIQGTKAYNDCEAICKVRQEARNFIERIKKVTSVSVMEQVRYIDGRADYNCSSGKYNETGFVTPFTEFPVHSLNLKRQKTQLLVAGAGTAGAMVALSACQRKTPVTVIEYFNELGGTKTMAGVNGYYRGHQEHKLIKELETEIKRISAETNMVTTPPRSYYYLKYLSEHNCKIINGTIICGAEVYNKQLNSLIICENGKLSKITATLTVDATGDGDVGYFSGEKYSVGDSRMGITQNYSHWDVPFRPKVKDYNRDYDIINSCEVLETQRGLYLSHYESHFYDFYPMLAIRESRRINAVYTLNTCDIIRGKSYKDVIAQAKSDYDPHYFSTSEMSRCGFMLPHFDNEAMVNIPYRAIVPESIDGLLLSGKAIGQSYKALQFTRMSADVTVLGYVTGIIASQIVKKGCRTRDFDVTPVQNELIADSFLPSDITNEKPEELQNLVNKLSSGDENVLFRCCVEERDAIVPYLKSAFEQNPTILLAKALAWFGDPVGCGYIVNEIRELYKEEQREGHPADYFEVYDKGILYWKINRDIALLGMAGTGESDEIINRILKETESGGKMVVSSDAYTRGRIDLQLIPYYNRIVNLCYYIERRPDNRFVKGLESLLDDPNIHGYRTDKYDKTRWKVYSANLELLLGAAAFRCGSDKGVDILVNYLGDIHADFRRFAKNELTSVYNKEYEYDVEAWSDLIKKHKRPVVSPLVKPIEV